MTPDSEDYISVTPTLQPTSDAKVSPMPSKAAVVRHSSTSTKRHVSAGVGKDDPSYIKRSKNGSPSGSSSSAPTPRNGYSYKPRNGMSSTNMNGARRSVSSVETPSVFDELMIMFSDLETNYKSLAIKSGEVLAGTEEYHSNKDFGYFLDTIDKIVSSSAFSARSGGRVLNLLVKYSRSSLSAEKLTRMYLKESDFLQKWVSKMIDVGLNSCTGIDRSVIVYSAGVLGLELPESFWALWFETSSRDLAESNGRSLSNIIYGFAKLGEKLPAEFLRGWFDAFEKNVSSMTGQALSNSLWACASLGLSPPDSFITAWLSQWQVIRSSFDPQALANSIWAFGKLGFSQHLESKTRFLQEWCEEFRGKAQFFRPQELASSAWALGSFKCTEPLEVAPLWWKCFVKKSTEFNAPELSISLYSWSRIGYKLTGESYIVWRKCAFGQVDNYNPQEISNIIWSTVAVGLKLDVAFLERLVQKSCSIMPRFAGTECGAILWSLAYLNDISADLRMRTADLCYHHLIYCMTTPGMLESVSNRTIATSVWSLAKLKMPVSSEFLLLWIDLFSSRKNRMSIGELCMSIWGISRYKSNVTDVFVQSWEECASTQLRDHAPQNAELCMIISAFAHMKKHPGMEFIELWLEALDGQIHSFGFPELAISFQSCAELGILWTPAQVDLWLDAFTHHLPDATSSEMVSAIWSMSLHYRNGMIMSQEFVDKWTNHFEHNAYMFNAFELATILLSCAHMKYRPSDHFVNIWTDCMRKNFDKMNPQALSNMIWAAARLNLPLDTKFVTEWFACFQKHANGCGEQALSSIIWAISCLNIKPPLSFWSVFCNCLEKNAPLSAQSISVIFWACARMQLNPPAFLVNSLGEIAASHRFGDVRGQGLANIIWSLSKLQIYPTSDFMQHWYSRFLALNDMNPRELNAVVWAFGRLDLKPSHEVVNHCIVQSLKARGRFTLRQLASVMRSLTKLSSSMRSHDNVYLLAEAGIPLFPSADLLSLVAYLDALARLGLKPNPGILKEWVKELKKRDVDVESKRAIESSLQNMGIRPKS